MAFNPNATVSANAIAWSLALDGMDATLDAQQADIVSLEGRVTLLEAAPTPTPTPTPTALRADRMYNEVSLDTAANTLIHNVYGVADTESPALSPNDGRFVLSAKNSDGSYSVKRGTGALSGGFINLKVTAGSRSVSVATIIGDYQEHTDKYRNVIPTKRPQWFNNLVLKDLKNTNQHYDVSVTHTMAQSGRFHDAATWVGGVVPDNINPVTMRCWNPETLGWDMTNVGTATINTAGYDLLIDQSCSFKDAHGGGLGSIKIRPKDGTDIVVATDSALCHGLFDVSHDPAFSTVARQPRVDIVFYAQEAPLKTARLGFMWMAPHSMVGIYKQNMLFADAIADGATTIHAPGLATANWQNGDWLKIPPMTDAVIVGSDPGYVGPTTFWGKNWEPVSGNHDTQDTQTEGFILDTTQFVKLVSQNLQTETIVIDAGVTGGRPVITETGDNGTTFTFRPVIGNMTRSVRLRSADPSTLQTRFHTMSMTNPNSRIEFCELMYGGRTAIDPSQAALDGTILYDRDPSQAGAVPVTNDLNVPGRYNIHPHNTGVMPCDGQPSYIGNSIWSPPVAGHPEFASRSVGIEVHGSKAIIRGNNIHGQRGRAYGTENGDEATEVDDNLFVGSGGDGFDIANGRAMSLWKHNGSGAALDHQSRSYAGRGNVIAACRYGHEFHLQTVLYQSEALHDYNQVSPPYDALNYSDPLAYFGGTKGYPPAGANPSVLNADIVYCSGSGMRAHNRENTDRSDSTPFEMTYHCLGVVAPFASQNYVNNYCNRKCVWTLNDRQNYTAYKVGGGATWAMSAVDCVIRNYAVGFDFEALQINLDGWLIGNDFGTGSKAVTLPIRQGLLYGGSGLPTDPRDHASYGLMAPAISGNGNLNPTTWTDGGVILSPIKNWSKADFVNGPQPFPRNNQKNNPSGTPQAGTSAFYSGVDPRGTPLVPGAWIDPNSNMTLNWNDYSDDTSPVQFTLMGAVNNAASVRAIGGNANSDNINPADYHTSPFKRGVGAANGYGLGHGRMAIVTLNKCFMDGTAVKTRLWFHARNLLTGDNLPYYADYTWLNMPAAIRDANLVTDPSVTRQNPTSKRERTITTPITRDLTPAAFVEPTAQTIARKNGKLDLVIRADNGLAKVTYEGQGASGLEVVYLNGSYHLRGLSNADVTDVDYTGKLVLTTPTGVRTEQPLRLMVNNNSFEVDLTVAGDLSGAQGFLDTGKGRYFSNGNGTSRYAKAGGGDSILVYRTNVNEKYVEVIPARDGNGNVVTGDLGLAINVAQDTYIIAHGTFGQQVIVDRLSFINEGPARLASYGNVSPRGIIRLEVYAGANGNAFFRLIDENGQIGDGVDCGKLIGGDTWVGLGSASYDGPADRDSNPQYSRIRGGPLVS
jgi:hypothetical protein